MRVFLVIVFRLVRDVVVNHKTTRYAGAATKVIQKITLLKYTRLTLIISIIALILSVYNLLVILGVLKMKLEDVMTTQEAAERWNVTADALKQNCRGRVKNGFKEGEFRKSGKMWLVTRQGMERLYGEEGANS